MRGAVQTRWFTTEQSEATPGLDAVGHERGPMAHAKQMGTNLTACGENAFTWSKLWHVPFDQAKTARCKACVDVVASQLVRRNRLADSPNEGVPRLGAHR